MTVSKWLKRWRIRRQQARQASDRGFTLLELLIAMLISSIIISGLLFLVTEMLKIERRETAIDDTQRDMKRALNYIAADVSEAVYVYVPDPATGNWPDAVQTVGGITDIDNVILAFWRPDFVTDDADLPPVAGCAYGTPSNELTDAQQECQNLRQRRAYYTLVAYEAVPNTVDNPTGVWVGQARLVRHELPKYADPSDIDSDLYDGDGPIDPEDGAVNFETWDPAGASFDGARNPSPVLVDYIVDPTPDPGESDRSCRSADQLIRIPDDPTASRGFYTCIRVSDAAQTDNQNLEIFIQGDPNLTDGQANALGTGVVSSNSALPIINTNVFIQGVIGYDPD
ncbi:MAG: prepilin-type N-terminal cleavage/methylation domain-containing protein [Cyanobacteria bacterium J06639_14]